MIQDPHIKFVPVEYDPFAMGFVSCAVPATESQKEIFVSILLGGEEASCSYNESISLKLTGPFSHSAMLFALQNLVNRHETLRSCFSADGNELLIYEELPISIYEEDLTGQIEEAQNNFITSFCKKEAALPFNLLKGPLFRIALFKLADEEYYLTFMVHHIICDGWSIATLLIDLSKLYTSFITEEKVDIGEAPKYSDYALEQIEFTKTKEFKETEAYWINQYKHNVPVVDLPTDFPRPDIKTYKSQRDDFDLNPELTSAIKKLASKAGCSFVTTFLISFEIYLHRLTGQEDIVVGLPAAGQSATANYNLVGHCVNLLPLRCTVNEDLRFIDFLAEQKTAILDAFEHQLLTFGSLLKKIGVTRDPSRVPLVPVVFNIDIDLDKDVDFFGLKARLISNPRVFENFEIFLNVIGSGERLTLEWSYNTQLFTSATIKQMMEGFEYMLRAITADESLRIKEIPIYDSLKTLGWQEQWNQTSCGYPSDKSLQYLISEQAKQYPNEIALEFKKERITYKELDNLSNQFAALLLDNGVQKGDTIALAVDRSEKTIISLLAILKAGAAYVPLDPGYPIERLQFMLDDSGSKIVLTSQKYKGRFQPNTRELLIEHIWPKLSSYCSETLKVETGGEDLAYILYTSGSTGKPKGVQIEHHSLINLLYATKKLLSVTPRDKLLSVTTISFDISGLEMYLPLISGASLIIADDSTVKDGYLLLKTIKSERPTIMQATPSTWRMLFEAGWDEDLAIKTICCGGEALGKDLSKKLLTRCTSLFNMYGPTETTIWSTVKKIDPLEEMITIGHPIDNTQVYILDKNSNAVPENTVGEIYIGGVGVARGYLNRPELMKEKFLANPFNKTKENKLYSSGDLGKFLANGEIQCLGRIDHQVKIRGHRIELQEIEQCLIKQDGIKQALVVTREKTVGDQRLVAYLITDSNKKAIDLKTIQYWKEQLKGLLPSYMIPNDIVILSAFPLTPNGKINRKLLPDPGFDLVEKDSKYTAPRSDMEKMIASIWTELLGVQKINVQDNFFELGGHSLIAAQLMTRLEKETGRRLPLTEIFKFSTLEEFASLFEDDQSANSNSLSNEETTILVEEPTKIFVPATESQMEIWVSCMIGGEDANRSYNLSISERLEGELDRSSMEHALQDVINRHESLRLTFSEDGKNICIDSHCPLNLYFEDLSRLHSDKQQAFINDFLKQNAQTPFDLTTGPLYRVALFKLSEKEHFLTITMHHIICDGWSLGVIMQELGKLYSAYVRDEIPKLPEAPLFSQYALEQQQFYNSELHKKAEHYWVDLYKDDIPILNLPTDFSRPNIRTYKSHRNDFPFDLELIRGIQKISIRAGCTLAMGLRAAFEVFLYRLTGQEDIVLGLPAAGQLATGNYNLVGHCVNLLAIRSNFNGNPSFTTYLQERKTCILEAYNHQQFTFGSLLKRLNIFRDNSRVPLVPVVFNIEMGIDDDVCFYELKHSMVFNPREYETFDIFLNIGGSDTSPTLEWSYNTQLFTSATIKQMMEGFEYMLRAITADESLRIKEIPIYDSLKTLGWQEQWNQTSCGYPSDKSLQYLISEQAKQYPNEIALEFKKERITYKELDNLSNQFAALLLDNGVQKGDTIALAVDRSEKTIISLLAILKAGAAYVPLDPGYPIERLQFMLDDSGSKIVLTSQKYKGRFQPNTRELLIEHIWPKLSSYCSETLKVETGGEDLAYILYTSGSTGKPKGVQIEHHSLINLLYATKKLLSVTPRDKLLSVTTISFDISGLEMYLPLISGASLIIADDSTVKDGYLLLKTIKSERPTIMQATPSTWRMLFEAGWDEDLAIKTICCGGEALGKDLSKKLLTRCTSLFNMYGPTETTIWSTVKKIDPLEEMITIGHPIDNTQVYILDKNSNAVPENTVGEIYIGGVGVARGYLNRPELMKEKFLANPFNKTKENKLYSSGDLGKFLANGEIQCLGRIDHQVKIRGHRIELQEIEQHIVQFEEVEEVVVIVREDIPGDQRLVAYIVSDMSMHETESYIVKWKDSLIKKVPSFMIPGDFVLLQKFPLTPNGKIDRKALPKPAQKINNGDGDVKRPLTKEEQIVAEIWIELLGLTEVSIEDNFFELGGHSLIAIQMMTRLEKETRIRMPLSVLFEYPTIKKLAAKLTLKGQETIKWNSLVPIKASGNKTPLYIVHGAGLNVLIFKSLADYMDQQQPVYGIQARGLGNNEKPLETIEEIAAFYIYLR